MAMVGLPRSFSRKGVSTSPGVAFGPWQAKSPTQDNQYIDRLTLARLLQTMAETHSLGTEKIPCNNLWAGTRCQDAQGVRTHKVSGRTRSQYAQNLRARAASGTVQRPAAEEEIVVETLSKNSVWLWIFELVLSCCLVLVMEFPP